MDRPSAMEGVLDEAEASRQLLLYNAIIDGSRYGWDLVTSGYDGELNNAPKLDITLWRYYRAWYHGGAPDDLCGIEFVYRTESTISIESFGESLRQAIKSTIPDNTPIHLDLDGKNSRRADDQPAQHGFKGRPVAHEPVKIKVTSLRPLSANAARLRGSPEWFDRHVDDAFSAGGCIPERGADPAIGSSDRDSSGAKSSLDIDPGGELSEITKFYFVMPLDHSRVLKDISKRGIASKGMRVTELSVAEAFSVSEPRQAVSRRYVYMQSPLEAGVDAICLWCAVVFRAASATLRLASVGTSAKPGIGTNATKIVAESIHYSRFMEVAPALLSDDVDLDDDDRLSKNEVKRLQKKLARLLVVFIELLHFLVARNRDLLLNLVHESKKGAASGPNSSLQGRNSVDHHTESLLARHEFSIQSELQRGFIRLVRVLHPGIHAILSSETPRWLKNSAVDTYFSSGSYRRTETLIADELLRA